MKQGFLTDPKHIAAWLKSMDINGWSITKDGLVDVAGNVNLEGRLGNLTQLPIRFGKVGGIFRCQENQLVSLAGGPKKVGGNFWCENNQLASLEGGPEKVGGYFACHNNQLVNLEGSPKKIGGSFYCYGNNLIDFVGLENTNIKGKIRPIWQSGLEELPEGKADNTIVSLKGLHEEYYDKVQDLDVAVIKARGQDSALDIMV